LHPLHAPLRAFLAPRLGKHPTLVREFRRSPWQFDRSLERVGLRKLESCTLGFGPFSFFKKHLFQDSIGITIHNALQRLADKKVPFLRITGAHYIVLAQKIC
jgi:hypothetical protein